MKLFKNLTNYYGEGIQEISINNNNYKTNKEITSSVIVAQSFGASEDKESYNFILAESIRDARKFFKKDLFAVVQKEIGKNLESIGETNYAIACENVEEGIYVNTREILKDSRKIIWDNGLNYKSVLYACHPAHTYRVMEIGRRLGLAGEPFIKKEITWPEQDSQYRVRSKINWIPREVLARAHHKINGIVN
jgi:hypothetical protein